MMLFRSEMIQIMMHSPQLIHAMVGILITTFNFPSAGHQATQLQLNLQKLPLKLQLTLRE